MAQLYKKPPITEAIIQVAVKTPLSDDLLDKIHKRLLEDYPSLVQRVMASEFEIEVTDAGPRIKQPTPGYKLTGSDGASAVIVFPKAITTSRLAPYEGWETFFGRSRQNWEVWKRLAGWHEIARVGVRYVNRIDIPLREAGEPVDLEGYLTVSPTMPPNIGLSPMNHFAVNAQAALGKDNCKLLLNVGSAPSPLVQTASFILDIDVVLDAGLPQNDDALWTQINRMREYKNTIFEASITDKTRNLFSS
jgi:uncharacterized protein (TIGR04255 family)